MGQEQLIKCVMAHSLEWSVTEESAVDRVAAIGMCGRSKRDKSGRIMSDVAERMDAGETVLRVNSLNAKSLRKIVLLIVNRLHRKYRITRSAADRIAFAALHELLRANCIHCGGIGEIYPKGSVTVVCTHCNGSGLHCYTDADRRALIGGVYRKEAYEDAITYLRDTTHEIVVSSKKRLGDYDENY